MAIASTPSPPDLRTSLRTDFEACRAGTLDLFGGMSETEFRQSIHPEFSPLGWHLGHIAYTEAAWLIGKCAQRAVPQPELEAVFHVDALPKAERSQRIPDFERVSGYAATVRTEMLDCLGEVPVERQERLWRFVLQHEAQHTETVRLLMALRDRVPAAAAGIAPGGPPLDWMRLPGGTVMVGLDSAEALDNERPRHPVQVAPFELARQPVRQDQYAAFMADGGYARRELWTAEGWDWLQGAGVAEPLYWQAGAPAAAVCGVSAHEAEAFCRWAGARLPTEFEWEAAAQFAEADGGPEGMLDRVWQWTASPFAPYHGFVPWPYPGYSQTYFDGRHRVLRGGSRATRPWARRPSFRNWYTPDVRQIFAGFRCARGPAPAATVPNQTRFR